MQFSTRQKVGLAILYGLGMSCGAASVADFGATWAHVLHPVGLMLTNVVMFLWPSPLQGGKANDAQ